MLELGAQQKIGRVHVLPEEGKEALDSFGAEPAIVDINTFPGGLEQDKENIWGCRLGSHREAVE